VDHKEKIAIGIVTQYFGAVPVGYIKETIPHSHIGTPYAPVAFKVIEGNLILQASYIKGKKIFPFYRGYLNRPLTGGKNQRDAKQKSTKSHS
jgi:hypothetical protein